MKSSDLVQRVTWELAQESIDNSTRLLSVAQHAAAQDYHGLAVSLSILSKEEAQKSLLVGFICSELYSIEDEDVIQELEECFDKHRYKIQSSWLVDAFIVYLVGLLGEEIRKTDAPEEMIRRFQMNVQKNIERLREKRVDPRKKLNLLKERGFYVGPDHEGNWSLPTDIAHDAAAQFLKEAEFYAALVNEANSRLMRTRVSEEWKSAVTEFRLIMKNKMTESAALNSLRRTGELGKVLAGFWEFLVSNHLVNL